MRRFRSAAVFSTIVAVLTMSPLQPLAARDSPSYEAQFIDKNGGYGDNEGGYYDPAAGTYRDSRGGLVDNWQGYTYRDGSYKAFTGDYWDAPTKTFKLANGEVMKSSDTSNNYAIAVLRQSAEEQGGFSRDGIRTAMMARIRLEHPRSPAKSPGKGGAPN